MQLFLIPELLQVLRNVEIDDISNVVQKLCCTFVDEMTPLAVEMTQHLVRLHSVLKTLFSLISELFPLHRHLLPLTLIRP